MARPVSVSLPPRPNPLSIASLLLHPLSVDGDDQDSLNSSPPPIDAAIHPPDAALAPPGPLPALQTHESFFGFIKEPTDAMILVEACVRGLVLPIDKAPLDPSSFLPVRSGSVVVLEISKKWRDGRHWSPSRAHGPFLLYREVETTFDAPEPRKARPTHILDNRIPGLEPTYSCKTLKQNTRLIDNGLTKRTITLMGSDGQRYRVICYYAREDIIHMYTGDYDCEGRLRFTTPTESPMFNGITTDPTINLTALLSKSIDLEKYASEEAVAKKLRKEESLKKAIARTSGSVDLPRNYGSPPKRIKSDYEDRLPLDTLGTACAPFVSVYPSSNFHQNPQSFQTPPRPSTSFSSDSYSPFGQSDSGH